MRRPQLAGVVVALTLLAPAQAVDGGQIRFREASETWSLDFRHNAGFTGRMYMVETIGGGVVLFDYDGDGDDDAFFIDGGTLPGYNGPPPRSRLLRNDASAKGPMFVDVTTSAGIDFDGYGKGGAAGDVDGDGDLDLYVTAFGPNELFLNLGDGRFRSAGAARGVDDANWSASAAFGDVDLDGDLDLYVTNYTDFSLGNHKFCGLGGSRNPADSGAEDTAPERGYCHPDMYSGVPDRFYRNNGRGHFVDATADAGLDGIAEAGLGVVIGDLNGDLWPDLYVANDKDPNLLFRNMGAGRFENDSLLSGTAYDRAGNAEAGMGVELADLDGDGRQDLVVTNFALETNAFYRSAGAGVFLDQRFPSGLAYPSLQLLAFGVNALDADLDGDLDLFVANGHIQPEAARIGEVGTYEQPNQLFENLGSGRFRERSGIGLDLVRTSRGSATSDLDLDGDLDLVVVNSNQPAEIYENLTAGRWFALAPSLPAVPGHVDAVGSRIALTAGNATQVREARAGSSYLSQSTLTVTFGLGAEERVRSLTVRLPSREETLVLRDLPANRRVRLRR